VFATARLGSSISPHRERVACSALRVGCRLHHKVAAGSLRRRKTQLPPRDIAGGAHRRGSTSRGRPVITEMVQSHRRGLSTREWSQDMGAAPRVHTRAQGHKIDSSTREVGFWAKHSKLAGTVRNSPRMRTGSAWSALPMALDSHITRRQGWEGAAQEHCPQTAAKRCPATERLTAA